MICDNIQNFSDKKPQRSITVIRHARSEFNDACEEFRVKNEMPWDWDQLIQHPKFADQVAYNQRFVDCELTKKGVNEVLYFI